VLVPLSAPVQNRTLSDPCPLGNPHGLARLGPAQSTQFRSRPRRDLNRCDNNEKKFASTS